MPQFIIPGLDVSGSTLGNISKAETFITNAGITDTTQKTAIRTLYTSLRDSGIWDKADFIYLFIGGTAASHKWNLKNPADTDAAFRLVFMNDVSGAHTSAGYVLSLASSRYAKTNYLPPTSIASFFLGANNATSETTGDHTLIGCNASNGASGALVLSLNRSFTSLTSANLHTPVSILGAGGGYDRTKTGLLVANRTSASDFKLWDAGAVIASETTTRTVVSVPTITNDLYIGAYHTTSPQFYSDTTLNFAIGGKVALTDQQNIDLPTMVATFNTAVR